MTIPIALTAEQSDLSLTAESEMTTEYHAFAGVVNTRLTRAANVRKTRSGNIRITRGLLAATPIKLTAEQSDLSLTAEQ